MWTPPRGSRVVELIATPLKLGCWAFSCKPATQQRARAADLMKTSIRVCDRPSKREFEGLRLSST
jgi:hypothetical protein